MLKRGFIKGKLKKSHVTSFFIIFTVSFMVFNAVLLKDGREYEDSSVKFSTTPTPAGVHSKIYIDGNTALNTFCTGNGTSGNYTHPHVIEDYEIDAGGSGSGIEIRNTDLYLIIRNITAVNSQGSVLFAGIKLENCINVNISSCNVSNNLYGFSLYSSDNNTINANNISDITSFAIYLTSNSGNNTISGNNIFENNFGMYLTPGSNENTISGNNFFENTYGMLIRDSNNNTIFGNIFTENGIYVVRSYENNIDVTNLVNGKPIYYYKDAVGLNIDGDDVGQLILVNCSDSIFSNLNISSTYIAITLVMCTNVTISNVNVSYSNWVGIFLDESTNCTLSGNNASYNNANGIYLRNSFNCTLSGNIISNNINSGIYLFETNNCTILGNTVSNNVADGILLSFSNNSMILGNTINNNANGIVLGDEYRIPPPGTIRVSNNNTVSGNAIYNNEDYGVSISVNSSGNNIYLNSFNNSLSAHDDGTNNEWDNGYVGNYWWNYTEVYPSALNDGWIWDTPYEISGDSGSVDEFPLVTAILEDLEPSAQFTANVTEINIGMWVEFTDTTTSGNLPLKFQWDFGDGSANSTEVNPTHQYNSVGNYSVTLTVTDADGDIDVIVKTDYIVVQAEEPPTTPAIPGFSFGWIFMFGLTGVVILLGKIQKKDRSKLNCS